MNSRGRLQGLQYDNNDKLNPAFKTGYFGICKNVEMKYKLNVFSSVRQENPKIYEFEDSVELVSIFDQHFKIDGIWLFANEPKGNDCDIIITERLNFICNSINVIDVNCNCYLQFYESYYDAYNVAIGMREGECNFENIIGESYNNLTK